MTRDQRLTLMATILGSTIVFLDSTVINVEMPAHAVHNPTARPRASPSNVAAKSAREPGTSIAPAIPCRARAPTNVSSVGAIAQSTEVMANPTRPRTNIRRRPNRSPSEPPTSRNATRVSR